MKLILTQEVSGLGAPGDVVEVKDGYGRNYLVPRGFAITWSRGGEKQIVQIRRARQARVVRDNAHAKEIKASLEGLAVRVQARAGDTGRLFGSITTSDIVEAVRRAGGPSLDRRAVSLPTPIKTLGTHKAAVRVHEDVVATLTVTVSGS